MPCRFPHPARAHPRWLTPLVLATAAAAAAPASVVSWAVDASGQWTTVPNWLDDTNVARLPGPGDDVTIDRPSDTYTITISSGTQSIKALIANENLTLSGGTLTLAAASQVDGSFNMTGGTLNGAGDVMLRAPSTWSGGTMSGSGKTVLAATGSLTLGSMSLARTIQNLGTATLTAGNLSLSGGAWVNESGATFISDRPNAADFNRIQSGGTFTNKGTFIQRGKNFTEVLGTRFDNDGSVRIERFTLGLYGGGTHTGSFTIDADGNLSLDGAHNFLASSSVTGAGSIGVFKTPVTFGGTVDIGKRLSIYQNATVTVNGAFAAGGLAIVAGAADFNANASIGALPTEITAGSLGGAGTVTFRGPVSWSGGTMAGTGRTVIDPSGSLAITTGTTLARKLDLLGSTTLSGNWSFTNGATVNNSAGATFSTTAAATIASNGGTTAFNNAGAFNKSGTATATVNVPFNNSGNVNVQQGNLSLANFTNSGTVTIEAGASMNVDGSVSLTPSSVITGGGSVAFRSATVNGALTNTGDVSATDGNSNTGLVFPASRTLPGRLVVSGTATVPSGVTLTLEKGLALGDLGNFQRGMGIGSIVLPAGSASTLGNGFVNPVVQNFGVVTHGVNRGPHLPAFTNQPGGVYDATTGIVQGNSFGQGSFANAGTVNVAPSTPGVFEVAIDFSNTGTVNVSAGTMKLSAAVSQVSGSSLTGGTWNLSGAGTLDIVKAPNITSLGPAASVTLSGPNAAFPKLDALATNFGHLALDGRSFSATSFFSNDGQITLTNGASLHLNTGSSSSGQFLFTGTGAPSVTFGAFASHTLAPSSSLTGANGVLVVFGAVTHAGSTDVQSTTVTNGLNGGSLTLSGPFASAELRVVDAPATVNSSSATVSSLLLLDGDSPPGATLGGSGTLTASGVIDWRNGRMVNPGTTVFSPTAVATITPLSNATTPKPVTPLLAARTLDNYGAITFSAGGTNQFGLIGATLNNKPSGTITYAGASDFSLLADLTPSSLNNSGTIAKSGPATLTIASLISVGNSGDIFLAAGTLRFQGALSNTGLIDLAGGTLQLDAGLAAGQSLLAQLAAASDRGRWTGPAGITSSLAAADPTRATAVGYTLAGPAVTLRCTWLGDANLDGVVDAADRQRLADAALLPPDGPFTWQTGDFNYDGRLSPDDYALFSLGAAMQTGSFPSPVPEPAAILITATFLTHPRTRRKS